MKTDVSNVPNVYLFQGSGDTMCLHRRMGYPVACVVIFVGLVRFAWDIRLVSYWTVYRTFVCPEI